MNKIEKKFQQVVASFKPIKKRTVLFCSFEGMYNDNPKYISEELYRRDGTIEIYWAHSKKNHDTMPEYIHRVEYGSREYIDLTMRAEVIIDNYVGIYQTLRNKYAFLNIIIDRIVNRKRRKIYNISTWHGTPLKHIGADTLLYAGNVSITTSDVITAGCEYTKRVLESGFPSSTPIALLGTPRNDILFHNRVVPCLKNKLKLPLDKRVVLFAPTFRDVVENSGVVQMEELEVERICSALEYRFGGEWCFAFRIHHAILDRFDMQKLIASSMNAIVDGNIGDDMAEYLACTDVLITDYSGSMFDFALTKKPCFLFAPDKSHYENIERGFYIDYDKLPFPKAYTSQELCEQIGAFDDVKYVDNINALLKGMGNIEDGHSSERIVDYIIHFIETGKKSVV